jgi:hypothetical protein
VNLRSGLCFTEAAHNVIFIGGTGETHLTPALRVRYLPAGQSGALFAQHWIVCLRPNNRRVNRSNAIGLNNRHGAKTALVPAVDSAFFAAFRLFSQFTTKSNMRRH